jgi:cytochrome c oxidase accessory protein FixG
MTDRGDKARGAQADAAARAGSQQVLEDLRGKIYNRSVQGLYANWRWGMVFFTQIIFYGLPWLQWNGRQALLFDLGARKFYLFGLVLWPQDVIYLAGLLIISALSLFLFTAVAGRLFCGYACPQTVYTEIFMWIERKVEGDRQARIRLDEGPWNARKLRLKFTKHALWLIVGWWTGSTFIGYFAPIRELGHALFTLQLGPWQWFWVLFYSFATWGNAGFMREAVCKYMCPYARFQSVMVDHDTLLVTYDAKRGEPRGGRSRQVDYKAAGLGECVDCSLCVQVCPTGIDIRDGLQYMCIGCGACIDTCDQVMDKMRYPQGLIRYTSERALLQQPGGARPWWRRARVLVYGALITLLAAGLLVSMTMRNPLRMDILRDRGVLGREVAGGMIENIYQLQLINTASRPLTLRLSVSGLPGAAVRQASRDGGDTVEVGAEANRLLPIVVRAPAGAGAPGGHPIELSAETLESGDGPPLRARGTSRFFIPE